MRYDPSGPNLPAPAHHASDPAALLERLLDEVAQLRRRVERQERELARLERERAAVCCPWWAQEWHRPH